MRRFVTALCALLTAVALLFGCQLHRQSGGPPLTPPQEGTLRIATWNVHYILAGRAEGRWGLSGWEARKHPLATTFAALDADIIGFQEMETFTGGNEDADNIARSWLLDAHPDYAAAAIGDWRAFPSTQPIFYRRARFDMLDQGWFFFSKTPDLIYSRTFDGSYPAFASWARFRDRDDGPSFRVVNVHFDYASRENRRRSADLVADRIAPWIRAGETVFLMGDVNARLGSSLHRRIEAAGLAFLPVEGATYHLDRGLNLFGAIDHIGYSADVRPTGPPMVLRRKLGDVWPTDHYPVIGDFAAPAP